VYGLSLKKAITKMQAAVIAIIVVIAVIAGIAYYVSLPTPTPTPATPTPKTPTPATPTPTTPTPTTPTPTTPTPTTPTPTPTTPTVSKIRLGTVQHLSGPLAAVAYYVFLGMQIGVKWINDRGGVNFQGRKIPVELVYYDAESKVDYAIKLVEKLIGEDKVNFVVLPWSPESTLATAPICERYKIVSFNPTGSDPEYQQGFKYVIGVVSGHGTTHFMYELKTIREADPKAKTIAFMMSSADIGGFFKLGVRNAAEKYGFTIIYDTVYPEDSTDLSPVLREIDAVKPDVLVGGTFPASGMLVTAQLRDLKIYVKWVVLAMIVNKVDFGEAFGKWGVGFLAGSPYEPETMWETVAAKEGKEYVGPTNDEIRNYWRQMGRTERIRADVGTGVDQPIIMAKCIEVAQSLDSDKIIQAATSLDVYTCRGRFKLDPTNPCHMMYPDGLPHVVQWQKKDNKLVYALVHPQEFATSSPIPMPTWDEKEAWPELTLEVT
jgi:branched-chain amino acid transport system substrate-binding protein